MTSNRIVKVEEKFPYLATFNRQATAMIDFMKVRKAIAELNHTRLKLHTCDKISHDLCKKLAEFHDLSIEIINEIIDINRAPVDETQQPSTT